MSNSRRCYLSRHFSYGTSINALCNNLGFTSSALTDFLFSSNSHYLFLFLSSILSPDYIYQMGICSSQHLDFPFGKTCCILLTLRKVISSVRGFLPLCGRTIKVALLMSLELLTFPPGSGSTTTQKKSSECLAHSGRN